MPVPFSFGTATSAIPLSQLDSNFNTPITLGNTAIQLGNTVTTLNNMTLANVTISSGSVTITSVNVANATVTSLTSGRVTYATTGGLLTDSANMTFNGTRLTVADFADSSLTSGRVTYAGASGNLTDSANLTFDGTNLTLGGGTANGVAYLNGSKALTTGSALTFDGTNLGVGNALGSTFEAANDAGRLVVGAASGNEGLTIYSGATSLGIIDFANSSAGVGTYAGFLQYNHSANALLFGTSSAEQMRLTSTGLGIGTSSPATQLDVASNTGTEIITRRNGGRTVNTYADAVNAILAYSTGALRIGETTSTVGANFTERMRLDSAGNLGLGVTPSAATLTTLEVPNGGVISFKGSSANITSNAYYNAGWKYTTSSFASYFAAQGAGGWAWFTAPSGTAGNAITFTQAMTLDASGFLGIGTSAPAGDLHVLRSDAAELILQATNSGGRQWLIQTGDTASGLAGSLRFYDGTAFAERMRLDSSGNLGIAAQKVFGSGNGYAGNTSAASSATLELWDTNGNTKLFNVWGSGNLLFGTANTERARITSGGDLLVGVTTAAAEGGFTLYPQGSSGAPLLVWNRASTTNTTTAADFRNASTSVGNITYTNTATAYNTSSDYRLKDNPQPLTGSGAFIDALKPKTWNWKSDGSKGVGFIAHEVQEVSPGTVTGEKDAVDEEGKPVYQAMEYGSAEFIANIIAELQSLRARVAQLESKGA